jgi:hypothetical protein
MTRITTMRTRSMDMAPPDSLFLDLILDVRRGRGYKELCGKVARDAEVW